MGTGIKKIFYLGTVAVWMALDSFITAELALGLSVNEFPNYPVVSSLDSDRPICYIQQADGSTWDLSKLCSEDETRTRLSQTDRKFLDTYNNLMANYHNSRTVVTPDAEKKPQSLVKIAQGVCSTLKNKVPLDRIEAEQYQRIIETEDPRNQKIALIQSDMINSLALKFYCPELAKQAVTP